MEQPTLIVIGEWAFWGYGVAAAGYALLMIVLGLMLAQRPAGDRADRAAGRVGGGRRGAARGRRGRAGETA